MMPTKHLWHWVIPLLLAALIGCDGGSSSSGKNKTDDPPDMEEILAMRPLDQGLQWSPGLNGANLEPPAVKKIAVPAIRTADVTPLGDAWEIEMDGEELEYPVHISFPLPDTAKDDYDKVVFVKISGEEETEQLLAPASVDESKGTAILICSSFSKFIPATTIGFDSSTVVIEGEITLREGAEAPPPIIYVNLNRVVSSWAGHPGEPVGHYSAGIGTFRLKSNFPESLYGSYLLTSSAAKSAKYEFEVMPRHSYDVDGALAFNIYFFDFLVVPTNSRIEGKVTDFDGKPMAGLFVELYPKKNTLNPLKSKTGSDGTFVIEKIFHDCDDLLIMNDPDACAPPLVNAEIYFSTTDDHDCHLPINGDFITLTAGQTLKQDFVYEHPGEVKGSVVDQDGNDIEGARVTLESFYGPVLETVTDFTGYEFREVPVGTTPSKITAFCPDDESKHESIEMPICDETFFADDIVLNCEDTDTYELEYIATYIGDPETSVALATKVEAETSFTFTIDPESTDDTVKVRATMSAKYSYGPAECWTWSPPDYFVAPVLEWTITRTIEDGKEEFRFESVEMITRDPVSVNCQNFCQTEVLDCGHEEGGESLSYFLYIPHAETWYLGMDYSFTGSQGMGSFGEFTETPGTEDRLTYYHANPVPSTGAAQYREAHIVLEKK